MINSGSRASCSPPLPHCPQVRGILAERKGHPCSQNGTHRSETQAMDGLRGTAVLLRLAIAGTRRDAAGTGLFVPETWWCLHVLDYEFLFFSDINLFPGSKPPTWIIGLQRTVTPNTRWPPFLSNFIDWSCNLSEAKQSVIVRRKDKPTLLSFTALYFKLNWEGVGIYQNRLKMN